MQVSTGYVIIGYAFIFMWLQTGLHRRSGWEFGRKGIPEWMQISTFLVAVVVTFVSHGFAFHAGQHFPAHTTEDSTNDQ